MPPRGRSRVRRAASGGVGSDALWVGTSTDGVDGRKATDAAAVMRPPTRLEGSGDYTRSAGHRCCGRASRYGGWHDVTAGRRDGVGMDVGAGRVGWRHGPVGRRAGAGADRRGPNGLRAEHGGSRHGRARARREHLHVPGVVQPGCGRDSPGAARGGIRRDGLALRVDGRDDVPAIHVEPAFTSGEQPSFKKSPCSVIMNMIYS